MEVRMQKWEFIALGRDNKDSPIMWAARVAAKFKARLPMLSVALAKRGSCVLRACD